MKKFFFCSLVLFFASFNPSYSQDTIYLKNALYLPDACHYGREAVYTDALAYRLYNKTLQEPKPNGQLGNDAKGNLLKWRAVKADRKNAFNSADSSHSGYLYFNYDAGKEETVLLNTTGSSSVFVNNILHAGDPYETGWLYIPAALKKGRNQIYVRTYGEAVIRIVKPGKPVLLSVKDATLPDIVIDRGNSLLQAAVVIINTNGSPLVNYKLTSTIADKQVTTDLPFIPALSSRKVVFTIDGSAIAKAGRYNCTLKLFSTSTTDEQTIGIQAVSKGERYASTFISKIDGSLQYYAVTPQRPDVSENSALFLSLHGAGVEARGQAAAYEYKDWGTLVAATNRRPRGFNWEDWGRLDALEVLTIAERIFRPDPNRIYLTGHSMGGHGTWFLGAAYPDKWAAIGPCSGYPSLKDYGSADGKIPETSLLSAERMNLRGGNQSDVLKLLRNYKSLGIYLLHGDADQVVPVAFSRQMRDSLSTFHTDFVYHEEPGGSHWFGNQSVDYPALFDFFKSHQRVPDSTVNQLDFVTANPGVASSYRWASIIQQQNPLQYSAVSLKRNEKRDTLTGSTANVETMKISLADFPDKEQINIQLDNSVNIMVRKSRSDDSVYLKRFSETWAIAAAPNPAQKNPARNGTFKEAFNNNMVFVFSTHGTEEENFTTFTKAVYDAETWYYRGNGAVDIIPDAIYTAAKYAGRNVIIYGNATTNSVWNELLANCPLQVARGKVTAGNKTWTGDDLAAYFIWPQADAFTSVGVVAGTGLRGMHAAAANQYFTGGSGFPDFLVFTLSMLKEGATAIKLAGYFDNNWNLAGKDMVQTE